MLNNLRLSSHKCKEALLEKKDSLSTLGGLVQQLLAYMRFMEHLIFGFFLIAFFVLLTH